MLASAAFAAPQDPAAGSGSTGKHHGKHHKGKQSKGQSKTGSAPQKDGQPPAK